MARILNNAMSSEVHINHSIRHSRRCKQTKGAEILADNIDPLITELEEKRLETRKQKLLRDNRFDDLIFNEGILDDQIRNISETVKQFDRKNPGRPVYKLIFPEGGFSNILRSSHRKKANSATQIIERLKYLGEEHTLFAQIPLLTAAVTKQRAAMADLQQAETQVRTTVVNEEVAQANLRKQYEFNYLDATKMFGKTFANRLFPQTVSRKKVEEKLAPSDA